jgi:hypothetical protein
MKIVKLLSIVSLSLTVISCGGDSDSSSEVDEAWQLIDLNGCLNFSQLITGEKTGLKIERSWNNDNKTYRVNYNPPIDGSLSFREYRYESTSDFIAEQSVIGFISHIEYKEDGYISTNKTNTYSSTGDLLSTTRVSNDFGIDYTFKVINNIITQDASNRPLSILRDYYSEGDFVNNIDFEYSYDDKSYLLTEKDFTNNKLIQFQYDKNHTLIEKKEWENTTEPTGEPKSIFDGIHTEVGIYSNSIKICP